MTPTTPTFRGVELEPGRQRLQGIMTTIRQCKRAEAEARNAKTTPNRKRQTAKRMGFRRHSERIRHGKDLPEV